VELGGSAASATAPGGEMLTDEETTMTVSVQGSRPPGAAVAESAFVSTSGTVSDAVD